MQEAVKPSPSVLLNRECNADVSKLPAVHEPKGTSNRI